MDSGSMGELTYGDMPLILSEDRYSGAYISAILNISSNYWCIPQDILESIEHQLDVSPNWDDVSAMGFWQEICDKNYPVGFGSTHIQAVKDLEQKLSNFRKENPGVNPYYRK